MKRLQLKKNNVGEYSIKIRWPLGCLLYFIMLSSCYSEGHSTDKTISPPNQGNEKLKIERAWNAIRNVKSFVRHGDLVMRTGNDFTSQSLRKLNQRNQTYSHCGIASIENDTLFVYHAMGGEFNPDQKIKRETWEDFAEPFSNRGVGVYRFRLNANQVAAVLQKVQKCINDNVTFDMRFDLATDDKMYCAEFIAKSYTDGSLGALSFNRSRLKDFDYFGVDDLYLHPGCDSITSAVYK